VRQLVEIPGAEPFEVWCARPEDVIGGKLMAWKEGQSRKHEMDILEMIRHSYMQRDATLNEEYIDQLAKRLGEETDNFWQGIKSNARREADEG
jgi:hypothetical protein